MDTFLLVLSLSVSVGTTSAPALEYQTQRTSDLSYIVVSGPFQHDKDLTSFLETVRSSGAKVVAFDSPGGSTYAAMKLGRIIRAEGLSTLQIRRMECASACALAFLGGVERWAEPGSIGVHRSSFNPDLAMDREQAVASIQEGTADILAYLREMGVDQSLLEFALRYDQSDIRYLSASEMQSLRVTNLSEANVNQSEIEAAPQVDAAPQTQHLEAVALAFVKQLVEEHGNDTSQALATVLAFYGQSVSYYGKPTTLADVLADKQSYFMRWPERGYHIRDDSVMVTCANSNCMVSGIYDWIVRSVPRNKQAKGVAKFSYTIQLGINPKIVAEGGEVIR